MTDLFGNHIVGFPTRRLKSGMRILESIKFQIRGRQCEINNLVMRKTKVANGMAKYAQASVPLF